jgi:TPR repeat protein
LGSLVLCSLLFVALLTVSTDTAQASMSQPHAHAEASGTPAAAAASSASSRPSVPSAAVQAALQKSPLHIQLLLMLSNSATNPAIAAEADKVMRMLHRIFPDVDRAAAKAAGKSMPPAAAAAARAPDAAADADWSPEALAKLEKSTAGEDILLHALLRDPSSPHAHLRDAAKALQLYGLAAVKMPSAYAAARLAHFFITGEQLPKGVGKDVAKGAKWLQIGAKRGHAVCQYQLGFLHEEGWLGQPNFAEAVHWYGLSAEQKYPQAMFNLASLLLAPDGTHAGVTHDTVRAIRLMEDAAALGDVNAQLKLGHLCFLGDAELDIEASIPRCLGYLTLAAHNPQAPSVDAAKILGIIYSMENNADASYDNEHYDLKKAIKYLTIAARSGHTDSAKLLQIQLEKVKLLKQTTVQDDESEHARALRLLSAQEGKPLGEAVAAEAAGEDLAAAEAVAAATVGALSTPSDESLLLALTRLHARFPELGSAKLHAKLKAEYAHWAVSEKRVKKVAQEQKWKATTQQTAAEEASASAAAAALADLSLQDPVSAAVAAVASKQRIGEVVNDLD